MTDEPDPGQTVRLSVPASARFLSSARVVATSVGAESGFSVDDLEDLRLGVNELVAVLVEGAAAGARVDLEFAAADGSITVTGSTSDGSGDAVADELTRRILEAVVDHHELAGSSFALTKVSSRRERI